MMTRGADLLHAIFFMPYRIKALRPVGFLLSAPMDKSLLHAI
jgi:hypothetical protein